MVVTREKLYEEVWAEPMTTVAKRYGVTSTFLARVCERLDVPRPPRGYWAKLAFGQTPKRPLLPRARPGGEESWSRPDRPKVMAPPLAVMPARKESSASDFKVPERLENPHPLVEMALASLQGAKPHQDGFLRPPGKGVGITTTATSLPRAARLMDTLLKAAERCGYKCMLKKGEDGGICIEIGGQAVDVSVIEDSDQSSHTPTKEELAKKKEYPWTRFPKYDNRPSGRLAFVIDRAEGCRSRFSEGSRRRQEDKIEQVLKGIETTAAVLKAKRLEWERREREWEAERKRKEEAARLFAEEKQRVEDLGNQLYRWNLAKDIRALVSELRAATSDKEEARKVDGFDNRLEWAIDYADRVDPVTRTKSRYQTGSLPDMPPLPTP